MNRRSFLGWVGVGTLASSLPLAIVACSNSETNSVELESNASAAIKDDFQMVGVVTELEETGFILNESLAANPVMVFRHPETGELTAINPQCPHQKCNVDLDTKANLLVCPCHDSRFEFDGKVVKSPARKSLDVYPVKQEGYIILVNVS